MLAPLVCASSGSVDVSFAPHLEQVSYVCWDHAHGSLLLGFTGWSNFGGGGSPHGVAIYYLTFQAWLLRPGDLVIRRVAPARGEPKGGGACGDPGLPP